MCGWVGCEESMPAQWTFDLTLTKKLAMSLLKKKRGKRPLKIMRESKNQKKLRTKSEIIENSNQTITHP
jgi:hypothetical protein